MCFKYFLMALEKVYGKEGTNDLSVILGSV
jgi:hypothetical protein